MLRLSQQGCLVGLLSAGLWAGLRLLGDEGAGGGSRVDRQAPPPAIDPDQPVIPVDLYYRPHQVMRHGVEGSLHLDVAPGGGPGSPLKDV